MSTVAPIRKQTRTRLQQSGLVARGQSKFPDEEGTKEKIGSGMKVPSWVSEQVPR
jgi:hypothetical protein